MPFHFISVVDIAVPPFLPPNPLSSYLKASKEAEKGIFGVLAAANEMDCTTAGAWENALGPHRVSKYV